MKYMRLWSIIFSFSMLVMSAIHAGAQNYQPPAPSLDGLKIWIQEQRPSEDSFTSELSGLPDYPQWYGSCFDTTDLLARFARQFKKECVDETYNSTVKIIGDTLEATRSTFHTEVRNVIKKCVDDLETNTITPQKIANSLSECTNVAKDIQEKAERLQTVTTDAAKLTSIKAVLAFTGMTEKLVTGSLTCTLKAMLTSGDMTERQRRDVKQQVDDFLSLQGKIPEAFDLASHLSAMAVTVAENGLELFQSDTLSDFESILIELDKISVSQILKEKSDQLLKSISTGNLRQTLDLEERGLRISHLMNSCQVDQAMDDLEIFNNMVTQEFIERHWAISKAEKAVWCSAFDKKYDTMTKDWQKWNIIGRLGATTNYQEVPGPSFNPPRSQWYHLLDEHQLLINKMKGVYAEFSPDKVDSARREEKRERELLKNLTAEYKALIDQQCTDENYAGFYQKLDLLKRRLVRARDSDCGKTGLAKEYRLYNRVDGLDFIKKHTETQVKIREETIAAVNNLLTVSFCKPSDASKVLQEARLKLAAMKLDRQRIDNDQSLNSWAEITAPGAEGTVVEIDGYEQCYASAFSELEEKIKKQYQVTEEFLKEIDADIQPARRALENCEGGAVLPGLNTIRGKLAAQKCNSSPGISVRLREIDILENALAPENCKKSKKSPCSTTPVTASVLPGKYYILSDRIYGSDGAAHCLTVAEAKAVNDKPDSTATLIKADEVCSKCSKGYSLIGDKKGAFICAKCPENKRYDSGCCL